MTSSPKVYRIVRRAIDAVYETRCALGASLAESGLTLSMHHSRLRALKNIHKGETAFLIGNGPSVRPCDLDQLQTSISFCCNRFHLAHKLTKLRATYTVSADRQMIEDFGEEIVTKSGGTVFIVSKACPQLSAPFVWLRFREVNSPFTPNVLNYVFPHGASLVVGLQVGYYMGIRKFYLYGVDHHFNYHQSDATDPFRSAIGDGNHFIPSYRGGKQWCPPASEMIERAFVMWHRKLSQEGGGLFNATRGGHLTILPRTDLSKAIRASSLTEVRAN